VPTDRPTRRRAIAIFAATAASLAAGARSARADTLQEWRGIAMGADATIRFSGIAPDAAREAARLAAAEIERLERALSLFRDESDICRLNRDKRFDGPSSDLRAALTLARDVAEATGGLYDPTVQPLWEAHVDWFADNLARALPPDALIEKARALVDWRKLALSDAAVRIGAQQRLTLNGLGQGYVTDRVAGLLRARGLDHVLVDLGEQLALGPRESGLPWMVAREGGAPIALRDGGLATSEGSGCIFGANGEAHHLFDPRSGRSARHWRRITVHHRHAAVADALSTALYAAGPQEMAVIVAKFPGVMVWATDRDGQERTFATPPVHGAATASKG
jgi:thiamine biosynthesis lipoprotein